MYATNAHKKHRIHTSMKKRPYPERKQLINETTLNFYLMTFFLTIKGRLHNSFICYLYKIYKQVKGIVPLLLFSIQ